MTVLCTKFSQGAVLLNIPLLLTGHTPLWCHTLLYTIAIKLYIVKDDGHVRIVFMEKIKYIYFQQFFKTFDITRRNAM